MGYKEWHHAYLGVILMALGLLISFISIWLAIWAIVLGFILTAIGLYIYIDDFYQHFKQKKDPTYQSPLHKLNSYLSIKYSIIIKLNELMNKLFGK